MDVGLKVTDQPQESSFFDMVSGDNVLAIPLFQRPYRWNRQNFTWLFDDIVDIRNGATKSCFLGVVVCVNRGASPGRPIPWEIVDGQQRLSTLYLLLLAAVEVLARKGHIGEAAATMGTYLLVRPLADNPVNTKLVPSFADRLQFKQIWDGIMRVPGVAQHPSIVANAPRPPAPSGEEDGALSNQYSRIKRTLTELYSSERLVGLQGIVEVTAQKLSVVSISLRDPLVAPKIFERLNNRAELVTVADLVRNEVFAKASDDPAQAAFIFSNHWEPFSARFATIDHGLEKFLFPYGLVLNHNVTKADLFSNVREHWNALQSPVAMIGDMERFVGTFLSLEAGTVDLSLDPALQTRLSRIHRLGKPSSTYAFILHLCEAVRTGAVTPAVAVEILDVLESFLFRRAIGGIEPTGLHAVFKGLWSELTTGNNAPGATAGAVRDAISNKATILWPRNNEFATAIRAGNLYQRRIVNYALAEFELSREGESPSDSFWIEHILPQAETPSWTAAFGQRYEELVDTWANLIPLTGRMNVAAAQAAFDQKREEYENSIFASAREVAEKYSLWTPAELEDRANAIVDWALARWPFEPSV